MADLMPENRLFRAAIVVAAAAWALLGFYLAFLHEDSPTALSPVAEAAERTAEAQGYRFEMSGTVASAATGSVQMTGSGAYNGATDRFSMELSMSGAAVGGGLEMTEVGEGSTFYLSSPLFSSALPGGKSWMKVDLEELLGEGINADPREQLAQLESVADITVVGSEKIRGAQTTHYSALIDAGDVGMTGAGASTAIPTDIWIDANGYVRRQTVRTPTDFLGGAGSIDLRMDLFAFGSSPEVVLPPESLVFDGGELIEELGGLEQFSQ
jgi:hypothetical protein